MQMIGRIGKAPERLVYRGFRVERKGFLSLLSYKVDGLTHRYDMVERGQAAVVMPVDFRTREVYLTSEVRLNRPFGATPPGREWIGKVMRDGFTKMEETFEIPADEARIYEVVAGGIETGETPEAAAVRELREETGLVVASDRLVHVATYFPSIGGSAEMVHAFIADLPDGHIDARVEPPGDGSEDIELYRMSWDEAFDLQKQRKIETAATELLLRELKIIDLEGRK